MHSLGSNKQNDRKNITNTAVTGSVATATAASMSPTLVNDLLDENARLKRQLEDLQAQMNHRLGSVAPQQNLGPVITGLSTSDSMTARNQTARLDFDDWIFPDIVFILSLFSNGVANICLFSGTEVAANGTNNQKYVCCGGCRQWLAAPKDAKLVFCPGCQVRFRPSLIYIRLYLSHTHYYCTGC